MRKGDISGCGCGLVLGLIMLIFTLIPWVVTGTTRGNWFTFIFTDGQCFTLRDCSWKPEMRTW